MCSGKLESKGCNIQGRKEFNGKKKKSPQILEWKQICSLLTFDWEKTHTQKDEHIPKLGSRQPLLRLNPCSGSVPGEGEYNTWAALRMNSGSCIPTWSCELGSVPSTRLTVRKQPDSVWVLTPKNSPIHKSLVYKTEPLILNVHELH